MYLCLGHADIHVYDITNKNNSIVFKYLSVGVCFRILELMCPSWAEAPGEVAGVALTTACS